MDRWRRRRMVYRGKMMFYQKNYGSVKTFLLRVMLGLISVVKLLAWVIGFILPGKRERARKELRSNMDVIKLCLVLK